MQKSTLLMTMAGLFLAITLIWAAPGFAQAQGGYCGRGYGQGGGPGYCGGNGPGYGADYNNSQNCPGYGYGKQNRGRNRARWNNSQAQGNSNPQSQTQTQNPAPQSGTQSGN